MNELNDFIVHRIKQLRKQQHLSQDKLSEMAMLDSKYINKIENKRVSINVTTLNNIIKALNISYRDFFDFTQDFSTQNKLQTQLNSFSKSELKSIISSLLTSGEIFAKEYNSIQKKWTKDKD